MTDCPSVGGDTGESVPGSLKVTSQVAAGIRRDPKPMASSASHKAFDFGNLNFHAEDGPVANLLESTVVTLVKTVDDAGMSYSQANLTCTAASNGRSGTLRAMFYLQAASPAGQPPATLYHLDFGLVHIRCGRDTVARQATFPVELFERVDMMSFPEVSQTSVETC